MEEWRDIKGYEGHYQVSNYGRIKSLERMINYLKNGKSFKRRKKEIAEKLNVKKWVIHNFCRSRGIKISNHRKYKIDREELKEDFKKINSNVELAKKYKTNRHLIASYRNKFKKGEF